MAKPKAQRGLIKSLQRRSPRRPPRTMPPTERHVREAAERGEIWVKAWVPVSSIRRRLVYVKTTPERRETARNLGASRGNDFLLAEVGRQTKEAGKTVSSGATLSPWRYGGLPGRHRRVFGTPEGKRFVGEMIKRVKANAKKGKTTYFLDIGAGLAQHWLPVLRRLRKHGKVELEVLNPSPVGKELSPATKWHVGAIETKDFKGRQFDGVLCTYGGFDKSNHPVETLQKMARLTKKGGVQYMIFGRGNLGEGVPVTRARMREALTKVDPSFRITTWKEPRTDFHRGPVDSYRKDMMFVRAAA